MLKLCKISIALLFINLYVVYTMTGKYIPNGTMFFGATSVLAALIDAGRNDFKDFKYIKTEVVSIALFILIALISTLLSNQNVKGSINAIIEYLEKILFLLVIYHICARDNSIRFPIRLFLLITAFAAAYTATSASSLSSRVGLSSNISQNALGNLMVLGSFCLLVMPLHKHAYSSIVNFAIVLLFIFTTLLSGSRKSLYAIIILFVAFCVFVFRKRRVRISLRSLFTVVFLIAVIWGIYNEYLSVLYQSSMYERLFGRLAERTEMSDDGRIGLYMVAVRDWLNSPMFGIGFNNFVYKHGSYTHSAYAEVLACTGLVGCFTYFIPYVRTYRKLKQSVYSAYISPQEKAQCKTVYIMFFVFLFVGLGIGHLYDNVAMLELGIFMGYGYLKRDKINDGTPKALTVI